jgi:hypothetical protein
MAGDPAQFRVAMIGHGFMGAAHSHAWRAAPRAFELGVTPVLSVLCGRDADGVARAFSRYGFASTTTNWKQHGAHIFVEISDARHWALTIAQRRFPGKESCASQSSSEPSRVRDTGEATQ